MEPSLLCSAHVCYWLPFAGPWSFIDSVRDPRGDARSYPLIFSNDALYLHQYTYERVQLFFFINPLNCRHFDHASALEAKTFTEHTPMATADSVTVALSSYIYFVGGKTRDEILNTVQRYNTKTQSWECSSSMLERRYHHFAVNYMDRCIYVFGGVDRVAHANRVFKSSVERYVPEQNSWSYVASLHQPRSEGLACVFTHKIFVFGEEQAECGARPNCEIYDPLTDEWQMCCFPMSEIYSLKT